MTMNRTARISAILATAFVASLGGCLPIELDVSPGGEVLIPRQEGFISFDPGKGTVKNLYAPATNQPAFGVFSPDGQSILAISQTKGGGMGASFSVAVAPAGGEAKTLFSASNLTYALWSPDGTYITATRIADAAKAPLEKQLPELTLAATADGTRKTLASNCSIIHRWFPDSKHVLTLQIASQDKESDQYTAALVKLDVTTGTATPLAAVLGEKNVFFDLSPDATKVLFTAIKAGKAGEKLPAKSDDDPQLYELDIASGAVRAIKSKVNYAIYSPKGTKVLIGTKADFGGGFTLQVGDAALKTFTPVAKDALESAGEAMNSVKIYPGWIDDNTIHYLASRPVYGTAGKNLALITVGADGKGRKDLQTAIDSAIAK